MSRKLSFFYDICLKMDAPVEEHAFALRCIPMSFPGQNILDVTFTVDPVVPYASQRDGFGNSVQVGRIAQPHDYFRYTVWGTALIDITRRRKRIPSPIYRYSSMLTVLSPELKEYISELSLPDDPTEKAWALVKAVQDKMTYTTGVTNPSTTAAQAFALGKGVCQDYAHIYIAMARGLGLTARYVNGLPEGEGESHAWCEVWLDGIWKGIDPTRKQWTDDGYIRFNKGRDFMDCPMERGIFFGNTRQKQTVFMKVQSQ